MWGGVTPRITLEQYKTLRALAERKRAAEHRLRPSYAELADEWGVSLSAVLSAANRGIKRYDYEVHR
jgi:DNA-directed RNA polymerase specialized sigma24 family protein